MLAGWRAGWSIAGFIRSVFVVVVVLALALAVASLMAAVFNLVSWFLWIFDEVRIHDGGIRNR